MGRKLGRQGFRSVVGSLLQNPLAAQNQKAEQTTTAKLEATCVQSRQCSLVLETMAGVSSSTRPLWLTEVRCEM